MTGGQYSPLTPYQKTASTSPYGNLEQDFDICKLADAGGATYVARGIAHEPRHLSRLIRDGIEHKGFSFIEAISQCPTYYGRRNKFSSPYEIMRWFKERSVRVKPEEYNFSSDMAGMIPVGVLSHKQLPEFTEVYGELVQSLQEKGGKAR